MGSSLNWHTFGKHGKESSVTFIVACCIHGRIKYLVLMSNFKSDIFNFHTQFHSLAFGFFDVFPWHHFDEWCIKLKNFSWQIFHFCGEPCNLIACMHCAIFNKCKHFSILKPLLFFMGKYILNPFIFFSTKHAVYNYYIYHPLLKNCI